MRCQHQSRFKLPVENGHTLSAVQGFLRRLLESDTIEALLVPMRTPHGAITPALVSDPSLLAEADPLAPVLPVNAATLVGQLSVRQPRARIGAVLRSCELRALVELVKLRQASLDDTVLIGVECAGTYAVPVYTRKHSAAIGQGDDMWRQLYRSAIEDPANPDPDLRLACRMCEQPTYPQADITLHLLAPDLDQAVCVSVCDSLVENLGLDGAMPAGDAGSRAVDELVAVRTAARDAEFSAIRRQMADEDRTIGIFDACIRCHNCMAVCPICYCKTCVFRSAVFDHKPMQYVGWSRQKGACRMPTDQSLFHLTRLNHMGLSCVGCGMCTQACPVALPVGSVFRAVGQGLQATFDYLPGRSPDEPLPLVTFEENEWVELGEE